MILVHRHKYVRQNQKVARQRQMKIKMKLKMAPFDHQAVQCLEVQQWKEKVDHVRHVAKLAANRHEAVQVTTIYTYDEISLAIKFSKYFNNWVQVRIVVAVQHQIEVVRLEVKAVDQLKVEAVVVVVVAQQEAEVVRQEVEVALQKAAVDQVK